MYVSELKFSHDDELMAVRLLTQMLRLNRKRRQLGRLELHSRLLLVLRDSNLV